MREVQRTQTLLIRNYSGVETEKFKGCVNVLPAWYSDLTFCTTLRGHQDDCMHCGQLWTRAYVMLIALSPRKGMSGRRLAMRDASIAMRDASVVNFINRPVSCWDSSDLWSVGPPGQTRSIYTYPYDHTNVPARPATNDLVLLLS